MTSKTEDDPFKSLLTLEDTFYKEGYDLGVSDGNRAGLIEGRFFGLERGFDKYVSMGKLYGRAVIWTGRLPVTRDVLRFDGQDVSRADTDRILESNGGSIKPEVNQSPERTRASGLPANVRLEKHIRTLYALTEPESLSVVNDESSVSEFDDRFNRALGKIKVIQKLTETGPQETFLHSSSNLLGLELKDSKVEKRDGGIEDISGLHSRH